MARIGKPLIEVTSIPRVEPRVVPREVPNTPAPVEEPERGPVVVVSAPVKEKLAELLGLSVEEVDKSMEEIERGIYLFHLGDVGPGMLE